MDACLRPLAIFIPDNCRNKTAMNQWSPTIIHAIKYM